MNIRTAFNSEAIRTHGTALIIKELPCILLRLAGGSLGLSITNHNPTLEFVFAAGGAIIGEYIGHKYFSKNCDHKSKSSLTSTARRYGLALSFGFVTWGIHQAALHDHDNPEQATQAHSTHNHTHDGEHCHDKTVSFVKYHLNHCKWRAPEDSNPRPSDP